AARPGRRRAPARATPGRVARGSPATRTRLRRQGDAPAPWLLARVRRAGLVVRAERARPPEAGVSVSVVIPYRPDGGSRDRALAWVLDRWARECAGWQVIVESDAEDDASPWRKGLAVAHGLTLARGEVVVVADADSWSPGVREAAARVAAGAPWIMPHTDVV